jgi:hypothetical protein
MSYSKFDGDYKRKGHLTLNKVELIFIGFYGMAAWKQKKDVSYSKIAGKKFSVLFTSPLEPPENTRVLPSLSVMGMEAINAENTASTYA